MTIDHISLGIGNMHCIPMSSVVVSTELVPSNIFEQMCMIRVSLPKISQMDGQTSLPVVVW